MVNSFNEKAITLRCLIRTLFNYALSIAMLYGVE